MKTYQIYFKGQHIKTIKADRIGLSEGQNALFIDFDLIAIIPNDHLILEIKNNPEPIETKLRDTTIYIDNGTIKQ